MNRQRHSARLRPAVRAVVVTWICSFSTALSQDIEPRRWTHLPVGTNIVGLGYVYTAGDMRLEPASRIQAADVEMHTAVLSSNHYLSMFDQTARLDVQVPWQSGRWEGLLDGAPASTDRMGFGDPRLRLSVNLAGAPALRGKEFVDYVRQHPSNTTVGAALAVRMPLGEYYEERLINLGQNRWSFETQLGVLHTTDQWSFEMTGSAFAFTDNDEFYGGTTLEQDPLFAVQGHVVRSFDSGLWLSVGAAYGLAGETILNDNGLEDSRRNLLYGVSLGFPVGSSQSVRIGYIRGETFDDTGMDSHSLLVSWALRF